MKSARPDLALPGILHAIEHIEGHLVSPLGLNELAAVACCSPYHFHRTFQRVTGLPPARYIRLRRLAKAVEWLLTLDRPVDEIALECGFGHRQSLARAFRGEFGCSPDALRRTKREVAVTPKFAPVNSIPLEGGLLLAPGFVRLTAFELVGLPSRIDHRENYFDATAHKAAETFMNALRQHVPALSEAPVYYGHVDEQDGSRFAARYMPSVVLPPGVSVPEPFVRRRIPGGHYAVFTYVGNHPIEVLDFQKLHALYIGIYTRWLPIWRDRVDRSWHLERIAFSRCRKDSVEMDILFSIRWETGDEA